METTDLTSKSVTCSDAANQRTVTYLERVQAAATVLSRLLRCKQMVTPPELIAFFWLKIRVYASSPMCQFVDLFKILSQCDRCCLQNL